MHGHFWQPAKFVTGYRIYPVIYVSLVFATEVIGLPSLSQEVWEELKSEYITSKSSFRKLGEKYDIAHSAIAKRAAREGWQDLRAQYVSKVETELIKKNAKTRAQQLARITTAATRVLNHALEALDDPDQFNRHIVTEGTGKGETLTEERLYAKYDTRALKEMVGVVKDVSALLRELYDAPTPTEKHERKLANAKLKLEQARAEGNTPAEITVVMSEKDRELAE